jgi:mono/diheme cytochrome c family protein
MPPGRRPTKARPTPFAMPAYNWKLSDDEIAAVATFVRNAWGNAAPAVTTDEVRSLREKLHAKLQ